MDSDCESESESFGEEAEEVSDEQLRLELELAQTETTIQESGITINFDNMIKCSEESPSLLGMLDSVTEQIRCYLCEGGVVLIESVCKRFRKMAEDDAFWGRHRGYLRDMTRKATLEQAGRRQILAY